MSAKGLTSAQRIAYAHELRANLILQEVLEDMEAQAVKDWDGTTEADTEAREQAWRKRQAVRAFTNRINKIIREETQQ